MNCFTTVLPVKNTIIVISIILYNNIQMLAICTEWLSLEILHPSYNLFTVDISINIIIVILGA